MSTSGNLDGELDRTVGELLFGDAMAPAPRFNFCFLASVCLKEPIELFALAPMATEVVELQLAAGQIADNGITPIRQPYRQAGRFGAEQLHGLLDRARQVQS